MALAPCQEDRLHGRRAAADGVGPRMRRQVEARHGRLPPDDEIQLRQLPRELHPGRHEAREGQGRARGGLRAHAGRAGVLRLRGQYNNALHKRDSGKLLYSPADVPEVFSDLCYGSLDYSSLASDKPALLEFIARYRFIEAVRSHTITREHIAPLIQRYSAELREASKLYEPCISGFKSDVSIISLLNVNLEQKKIVPLVVAKTLYQFQKGRGQNERGSSAHLVVDEAHNILSYSSQRESENWRDYRLETFEEIVKEGRKFGMYLTVCSQRPADISPTILSQMHNYFIHRLVNDEDLRAIGKAVSFIDGANASMIPVLPQGCCIVSGTATTYPVRVQVDALELEKQPMSFDRDLAKAWGVG